MTDNKPREELEHLYSLLQEVELASQIVRAHIMELNFKTDAERAVMRKGLDKAVSKLIDVRHAVQTEQQREDELLAADVYI